MIIMGDIVSLKSSSAFMGGQTSSPLFDWGLPEVSPYREMTTWPMGSQWYQILSLR